jgi:hypothetical protein
LKQLLILMCLFAVAAGIWLAAMENILKHPGYAGRSVMDVCIAVQGIATLLFMLLNGPPLLRAVVIAGAAAITLLGGFAIARDLQAQHFEGFVLIIGSGLIVQGALTVAMFLWTRRSQPV